MTTSHCICLVTATILWTLMTKHQASALAHENNVIEGETCLTYDFYQNVTEAGCESKRVNTKACYGQCKSGIVTGARNGMMSCKSCGPTKLRNQVVALQCFGGRTVNVNVSVVMYCQCTQRRCPTKSGYDKNEVAQIKTITKDLIEKLRRRKKTRRRKCRRLVKVEAKEKCLKKIKEINRKLKESKLLEKHLRDNDLGKRRKRTFLAEKQFRDP